MNREIKFRAWIKPNEWVEGEMISQDNPSDFTMISNGDGFGIVYDHEEWLNKDAFIIMQYTGLKDKNGVEIYEGDIVQDQHYMKSSNPIVIHSGRAIIKYYGGGFICHYCGMEIFNVERLEGDDGLIVIGNIYENPELLTIN